MGNQTVPRATRGALLFMRLKDNCPPRSKTEGREEAARQAKDKLKKNSQPPNELRIY
jgi:hypothetical protein